MRLLKISSSILALLISAASIGNVSAASFGNGEIKGLRNILNQAGIVHFQSEMKAGVTSPQSVSASQEIAQNVGNGAIVSGLIVSFRSAEVKALSRNNLPPPQELIDEIIALSEVTLVFHRAMSLDRFVFRFPNPLSWAEAEVILNRVKHSANVESVEADILASLSLAPNDAYAPNQWNLQSSSLFPGSANLDPAWDLTRGSSNTVVAVVDSGVGPHSEFASRLLPGYDFVSDHINANDGGGRDNNASDPGNWALAGQCGVGTPAHDSSWHGTHVAGIIAATGNNSSGIAGINWFTRVLPVRVLGKCGGTVSDIIDGMQWAAGIAIPGVPANPYPAKIINMSLGGFNPGGCTAAYTTAINKIKAKGALIIVAAGNNDSEAANYVPASCNGVVTVGAVGPYGNRASYSNYSQEYKVDISAPGGDMYAFGNVGGIYSTMNSGKTVPASATYDFRHGTSMAAPHVAGVASLALAVDPQIAPEMLTVAMMVASRDFPINSECNTNQFRCGSGIIDAYETLRAVNAFRPYTLVYEYYNVDIKHYFRTGSQPESLSVLSDGAGPGWRDTKDYFVAWKDATQGAVPVCRFYGTPGKGPNSHFYTADPGECSQVKKDPGWTYEGIAFYVKVPVNQVCAPNTTPIYRLYNNRWMFNDSNHRFTTEPAVVTEMKLKNWILEGVAMCAVG